MVEWIAIYQRNVWVKAIYENQQLHNTDVVVCAPQLDIGNPFIGEVFASEIAVEHDVKRFILQRP